MMSGGFDIPERFYVPLFNKEACVSGPEFRNQENEFSVADSDEGALNRAKTCAIYLTALNKGKSFKVTDKLDENGKHLFKVVEGEGDTIRFDQFLSLNGRVARAVADTLTVNSNMKFKAIKYETNWLHSSYWFVAVDPQWVKAQAQR